MTWLPATARAVLLVSQSDSRWAGSAALELAEWIGRERSRTILVNTVVGAAGPDIQFGAADQPGLPEAMLGRRSVRDVAIKDPARSFIYVPAGTRPVPLRELSVSPPFVHLVRAGAKGGTVLLIASASEIEKLPADPATRALAGLFDGWVQIGRGSRPAAGGWPPLLARVEADEPAIEPPRRARGFTSPTSTPAIVAGSGREKRPLTRWEQLIRTARKPGLARGAGGVAAVWVVTVAVVWLVWQGLSGWPAFQEEDVTLSATGLSGSEVPLEPEGPVAGRGGEIADGTVRVVTPTEVEAEADGAVEGGELGRVPSEPSGRVVDLPYSVLVASYVRWEDASDRKEAIENRGDFGFIAPTVIGDRVYYRVFCGAVEDRLQAGDLMQSLVQKKTKDRERVWDMRPVTLAFALGDFDSESEATAERDRLHEVRLPAYVLPVRDSTGAKFRLYSGAFESETAASALDSMLSKAGRAAVLETRRGLTR